MRIKNGFIAIIAIIIVAVACSPKDRLINNYQESFLFALATSGNIPLVAVYEYPSGALIEQDIYFKAFETKLTSQIEKIAKSGEYIYLLNPKSYKISIMRLGSYEALTEIDFASEQLRPIDICFPNATSAYITFENSAKVALLDTRNLTVAKYIDIRSESYSIAVEGNSIVTANYSDNSISIIDSRTNTEEAVLNLSKYPYMLAFAGDNKLVVVCAGLGKQSGESAENSKVYLIDVKERSIVNNAEIYFGGVNTLSTAPYGLAINTNGIALLPVEEFVFSFNTTRVLPVSIFIKESARKMLVSPDKSNIIYTKETNSGKELVIADNKKLTRLGSIPLPDNVITFLPL